MSIRTKLIHLKIKWFGNRQLEKHSGVIPCLNCDKEFVSYCHYSTNGETYDAYCRECKNDKQRIFAKDI